MDDRQLDNIIKSGKNQAQNFFSHMDYSSARNAVYTRAAKERRPKPLWSFALKAGVVSVCLLCLVGITLMITLGTVGKDEPKTAAVSSQTVSLGNTETDCLINYFPVSAPDYKESSLVSVLWELGETSKMMYSTVFERCDEPYPASAVEFPGTGDTIILILSGDSSKNFINYRLLGYGNDAVKIWREKDFVPDGRLEVLDGVIVERRADQLEPRAIVSHIVPYEILTTGELMLPVDELHMKVGEQVLLVGGDCEELLKVTFENGLFEHVNDQPDIEDNETAYRATGSGSDVMLLYGGRGSGYLNVNISE